MGSVAEQAFESDIASAPRCPTAWPTEVLVSGGSAKIYMYALRSVGFHSSPSVRVIFVATA